MISVFGHLNPDTDAVTSALVFAHFLNRSGHEARAYRLGALNKETAFVLRKLGVEAPPLLEALPKGAPVALVDHNESAQSLPGLTALAVTHVVDHHKLGDLQTNVPVFLRFEPLGCTATILTKLHREASLPIEPTDAALLLSAILSDTLHFRSPSTTEWDREVAHYLAQIAGVADVGAYADELFAAKSDVADVPAAQLLKTDYKVFEFGGQTWGLGVIETTHPASVLAREEELLDAMEAEQLASGLAGVLLSVVDIMRETNRTLVLGAAEAAALRGAFDAPIEGRLADLGHRISRKKQVVPALEAYFGRG